MRGFGLAANQRKTPKIHPFFLREELQFIDDIQNVRYLSEIDIHLGATVSANLYQNRAELEPVGKQQNKIAVGEEC